MLSILNIHTDGHHASAPVFAPAQVPGSFFGTRFGKQEETVLGIPVEQHVRLSVEDKGSGSAGLFQPYTVNITLEIHETEGGEDGHTH